jgi:two-component system cell cycle response regulator
LHVAGMVAERLRRSIANEPFSVHKGDKRIDVTVSIGLSTLEHKGEPLSDVLKRADTALYRAKNDGRNRVVMLPPPNELGRLPQAAGGGR